MWDELPLKDKEEYKKMILAFASLTEMFAQKTDIVESDDTCVEVAVISSPIINSKYQETVFQRVFGASAEDIGNTSYDVALCKPDASGKLIKYLVGIKTFGYHSGAQKIAQFKAYHDEWINEFNHIKSNAIDEEGNLRDKEEINALNHDSYLSIARQISNLRNMRIDSSESSIHGFSISSNDDDVRTVYHCLMPSKKGERPTIRVGETPYSRIDVEHLQILGCTSPKNPTNFDFTDGNHIYRFTSADSQLLMNFKSAEIKDEWNVKYATDAYQIFSNIANQIYREKDEESQVENYSWKITNKKGEVELFSGFNSFYGVGSKLGKEERQKRILRVRDKFENIVPQSSLSTLIIEMQDYLCDDATNNTAKIAKTKKRDYIMKLVKKIGNKELEQGVTKLLFRPIHELYIPIPDSKNFHANHPDFFYKGGISLNENGRVIGPSKENRKFRLIYEPSGDAIDSFITQDYGKAIESCEKQSYLGEWILKKVFQLSDYEPLTAKKLNAVGINGIRLTKYPSSLDIHLTFIWIDEDELPSDYIK